MTSTTSSPLTRLIKTCPQWAWRVRGGDISLKHECPCLEWEMRSRRNSKWEHCSRHHSSENKEQHNIMLLYQPKHWGELLSLSISLYLPAAHSGTWTQHQLKAYSPPHPNTCVVWSLPAVNRDLHNCQSTEGSTFQVGSPALWWLLQWTHITKCWILLCRQCLLFLVIRHFQ